MRIVTSGTISRSVSATLRVASIARFRFIFSRTAGTVCWIGTSTYRAACFAVASQTTKSSVISLG